MPRRGSRVLDNFLALCALLAAWPANAQPLANSLGAPAISTPVLRIAAVDRPPYSYQGSEGSPEGSAVETLQGAAAMNGWRLHWVFVSNQDDAIEALLRDSADIALGGITLTLDRSLILDYADVFQCISLRTMILKGSEKRSALWEVTRALAEPSILYLFALGIVATAICAVLIRLIERGLNDKMFPPGYHANLWWCAQTLIAHNCGGFIPVSAMGRLIALGLMVGGTIFTAQMTALLTTQLTHTLQNNKPIDGPADYASHPIGTVGNSEAERWLVENRMSAHTFPSLKEAVIALRRGDVEAICFDDPALRSFLHKSPSPDLTLVGPTFDRHQHCIYLQRKSRWTVPLDAALQTMVRSGQIDDIALKWYCNPFHEQLQPLPYQ